MPLEDLDQIDIVLKPDADGKVGLVIMDAGVTRNAKRRRELLLEKVKLYFHAVRDGHFKKQFPKLKTPDFFIKVVCLTPPTPEMFEINHIGSRSRPEHHMEVRFEQPDGRAWPGAKFSASTPIEDIQPPSKALQKLAEEELQFGFETIRDRCFYVFAAWLEGKKKQKACIAVPNMADAVLYAQQQAAQLSAKATHLAIVYDAIITSEKGKQQDALMARASERGRPKGVLFGLKYTPAKGRTKAKLLGEPFIVDECENDLEPPSQCCPKKPKKKR